MTKREFELWRKQLKLPVTRFYMDAYLQNLDKSPIMREAMATRHFLENVPLCPMPGELINGMLFWNEPAGFHYGNATWTNPLLADQLCEQTGADCAALESELDVVRKHAYVIADQNVYSAEELRSIRSHAATSTWFGCHMVLDFERILAIGLGGYQDLIKKYRSGHPEKEEFYEALDILLQGVRTFASRCGAESVSSNPPETFQDALQLVWLLHIINNADSFGRFDQYLYPFYERDINSGHITREYAREIITDCFLKVEAADQIQNMTIGGTDAQGADSCNELTVMIIDVTRELGYKGPNLCLRVTPETADVVWESAVNCIESGTGLPAIYNDGLYVQSLLDHGFPLEDARNFCLSGCSQIMIPGASNHMNDVGMLNMGKVLDIALHGGYDPNIGEQVGPVTPKLADISSFDELMDAFYRQVEYFVGIEVSIHEKEVAYRRSREGYALRTLFIRDCLETGRNIFDGGARYNHTQLEIIGLTNCADSLYAVKRAVFDDGFVSASELQEAIDANFSGFAELRSRLLRLPKFGNDESEVDALRAEITDYVYRRFNESEGVLGGIFVPGEVIFTAHDHCGEVTGATPDGRCAGVVLADSAGASQGFDKRGPTALMNSVLCIPTNYLLTSIILNVKFLPGYVPMSLRPLLTSFFESGGMQAQINVCDAELLRDAQLHPNLHAGLVVRVGGYSDYFVRLSRALQDEIIARTPQ